MRQHTDSADRAHAAGHTANLMGEELYYEFNLRCELFALIGTDPDLYDRITLWLEGVQERRKAEKAVAK